MLNKHDHFTYGALNMHCTPRNPLIYLDLSVSEPIPTHHHPRQTPSYSVIGTQPPHPPRPFRYWYTPLLDPPPLPLTPQ